MNFSDPAQTLKSYRKQTQKNKIKISVILKNL